MNTDQLKAAVDYMKAKADFYQKVTPKYLRINENYLNEFVKNKNVIQLEMSSDGMYVDYQGIIPLSSIPVVIDNRITTHEFIYESQ